MINFGYSGLTSTGLAAAVAATAFMNVSSTSGLQRCLHSPTDRLSSWTLVYLDAAFFSPPGDRATTRGSAHLSKWRRGVHATG